MALTVYGIPTCGTVKKARRWLDDEGLAHDWVDLREHAPSRDRIATWIGAFGAKALRNTSGGAYRALGAEKDAWGEAEWLDAFAADPMLIKRPVIERDGAPVQVGFRENDEGLTARLG